MTAIEKAVNRVVDIAEAEIGYIEKASDSQLNDKTANPGSGNWTKYGAYFDAMRGEYEYYNGRKNGFDWCDQFVDWVFAQAFGIDEGRKVLYQPMRSCGAGCAWSASYFRENGKFTSTPQRGDQIFLGPKGNESHTGLVVDVSPDKVWTVEGNANNRVMRRVYARNDSNIAGYGRPNFQLVEYKFKEDTPAPAPQPEYATKETVDAMICDICGEWIGDIKDVPHKSVATITRALLDLEAVDGGTPYSVNPDDIRLPYNILRAIVIAVRYTDKRNAELERRIAELEAKLDG